MQAARLSKADEYHLKQRNKIEILFSLLKEKYTLSPVRLAGYLAGIYASLHGSEQGNAGEYSRRIFLSCLYGSELTTPLTTFWNSFLSCAHFCKFLQYLLTEFLLSHFFFCTNKSIWKYHSILN